MGSKNEDEESTSKCQITRSKFYIYGKKKKRQQIKKQILFFFNFLFFSLFELVVYLMDPQLMDETLQTPADVVSGTFL